MSESTEKKSFFTDLWERRFFQFLATYIAASWGLIQFTEWGVRRYSIPSHWVDKVVVFLLLMLPTVICLIYLHGRVGPDKWFKFEKSLYPINAVIALLGSLLLVSAPAQETTATVEITDEEGKVEVREVPKVEHTKRVAVFPFENDNGNNPSWKGTGSAVLLDLELEQDMRVTCSSPLEYNHSYSKYNYGIFDKIPFSVKKNIAEDVYSDFIIDGKFLDVEETKAEVIIYETATGKEVASEILTGSTPIILTEEVSTFVSSQIKLSPVEGQETILDLPASNLITADTAAFRQYILGVIIPEKDATQIATAIPYLQESIKIDPTCAECHFMLAKCYASIQQDNDVPMKEAMKYVNNLSERQQLIFKYSNYVNNQQMGKSQKLLKNWRKLYPQDTKPAEQLIGFYKNTLQAGEAKKEIESALADGHRGRLYLTYAQLLIQTHDWKKAEEYLLKYEEAYPKQAESATLLADTYAAQGKLDEAIELLDEMALMNPNDIKFDIKKAKYLNKENKFAEAKSIIASLLRSANNGSDTIAVYEMEMEIFGRQGQVKNYFDSKRKLKKVFLSKYPPIAFIQTEYATSPFYKLIEEQDSIKKSLDEVLSLIAPSRKELIASMNNFMLDLFTENVDNIENSYAKIKDFFKVGVGESIVAIYDSEIHYMKGEYKESIDKWKTYIDEGNDRSQISQTYYKAFYKDGRYKEGLEAVNLSLKNDQFSPVLMVRRAKFLIKLGKTEEAKKALDVAWSVYETADEAFAFRKQAVELRNELNIL